MSKKKDKAAEIKNPGPAQDQAATQPAQADPESISATDKIAAPTTEPATALKQSTEAAATGAAATGTAAKGPGQPDPAQTMSVQGVISTQPIAENTAAASNGHPDINNGTKTDALLTQSIQEESKGPAKTNPVEASQGLKAQSDPASTQTTKLNTNQPTASKKGTEVAATGAAATGAAAMGASGTGAAITGPSQSAPSQVISTKEVISPKPLAASTQAASSDHSLLDNGAKVGASLTQSTLVVSQQPSMIQEETKGLAKGTSVEATQVKSTESQSSKAATSQKPVGAQEQAGPNGTSQKTAGVQGPAAQNTSSKNLTGSQEPTQPTNTSQKPNGAQAPANLTSASQKPADTKEPSKRTDASQKLASAQDPTKPTSGSQIPAPTQEPAQIPATVISPEEAKQLEDLKKKIAGIKEARRAEEDSLQDMQRLVAIKNQLDSQNSHAEASIKRQNEENSQLEQQLITLQIEVKREELIKELNTLKTLKKSDAIINTAMKKQETDIMALITDASQEEAKLESQKAELSKQISRMIPEQVKSCDSEIQLMKAQKSRLTKEITAIKDKVNEINIQDVQLSGQGFNKLASQVAPASKANIEEADIEIYAQILDKISQRLIEAWKTLPAESIPIASPEKPSNLIVSEKQKISTASPEKTGSLAVAENQLLTPGTVTSKTSAFVTNSPISTNMFLTNILGRDVSANVQEKAQEAALAITKDKSDFVKREEQRKRFLEEDKLTSMKNIVEYEGEIENFDSNQSKLLSEIQTTKTAYALLQDTLAKVLLDKKQLRWIRQRADGTLSEDQEEELEAAGEEEEVSQNEEREEFSSEGDYVQEDGELREEDDFADDQVVVPEGDDDEEVMQEELRSEDQTTEITGVDGTIDLEGEPEEF